MIGWAIGPKHLINPIICANQWIVYCNNTPVQKAVANILNQAEEPYTSESGKIFPSYFAYLQSTYSKKRDALMQYLKAGNFQPYPIEGGFFIVADTCAFDVPSSYLEKAPSRDFAFARWLSIEFGVTPIPMSVFYGNETRSLGSNLGNNMHFHYNFFL